MQHLIEYTSLILTALCLYRETRGTSDEAQAAVATVILNRAGGKIDKLLDVITKAGQFSSMTSPKNTQLVIWPKANDPEWHRCLAVVHAMATGELSSIVGKADHFHDTSVNPSWADPSKMVAAIQNLRFYQLG